MCNRILKKRDNFAKGTHLVIGGPSLDSTVCSRWLIVCFIKPSTGLRRPIVSARNDIYWYRNIIVPVPAVRTLDVTFVGYAFESASAIMPFLEPPHTGITSEFCASTARRLQCYVAAGYPERLEPHEVEKRTMEDGSVVDIVGANSAVIYGPDGTRVGYHRKSHLFYMDEPWAKRG